jgi:hypothetical protein
MVAKLTFFLSTKDLIEIAELISQKGMNLKSLNL